MTNYLQSTLASSWHPSEWKGVTEFWSLSYSPHRQAGFKHKRSHESNKFFWSMFSRKSMVSHKDNGYKHSWCPKQVSPSFYFLGHFHDILQQWELDPGAKVTNLLRCPPCLFFFLTFCLFLPFRTNSLLAKYWLRYRLIFPLQTCTHNLRTWNWRYRRQRCYRMCWAKEPNTSWALRSPSTPTRTADVP